MSTRLIAALLFLLSFSSAVSFAQDDEDEPQPLKTTKHSGTFGVGGGITPHWLFLRTDKLNDVLSAKSFPEISDAGMFLFGGHGYAYIMLIPNLRIGGMGAGGSLSVERTRAAIPPVETPGVTYYDRATIATGFGGVTIEYMIPLKRIQLAVGGLIGGGSHSLTLTSLRDGDRTWKSILPYAGWSEYQHVFTSSFFAYQPSISIEYLFSPFTIIGLTGGYYGTSGNTWTMDDAFTVTDMPDIRFGGVFVRLGLTFGLFIPE